MTKEEYEMLDADRELGAFGFHSSGEETEHSVVYKDKFGKVISVAKEYENCPPFLKELYLRKLQSLHTPHPAILAEAYIVKEPD